jgi:hypothetical protein
MNEKELWQQFKDETEVITTCCPDILKLSAYMDNRLSKEEQERIEVHLNQCEECLESTLSLFEVQKEQNTPLPMSSVLSAQELIEAPLQITKSFWSLSQSIAASLFFIMVSFTGYTAGEMTYETNDLVFQSILDEEMEQFATVLEDEPLLFNVDTTGDV